ncbi:DUF2808 domain-containing protein [Nodosilinea sp. LEGE 07088]|uniref:DUF2808 domain-containing protein n=1 Tax=Nodosilinea sp. LEGE 07088 TaxID=2777968 RepID=UPI00187E4E64|nr:DUF2808 domain-containing protein [Nodosilinea sp. LEGE 07088]MBE9140480.1 DUF2808 domain-containing protein [Nodosilinea sp. LEGE 07088]
MKNFSQILKISALAVGILGSTAAGAVEAAQLADGRVIFDRPPTLVEATTYDQLAGFGGRYHFVIEVPDDAGEPLEAITIMPLDGARNIVFKLDSTTAQQGVAYANGPEIPLSSVGGVPENSDNILVVFDQPVQPGETATVTLQTAYNPWGGVYIFGVTGYPAGDGGVGQILGHGRIQIYDNSR